MSGRIAHPITAAGVSAAVILSLTACGGGGLRGAYRALEKPVASALDESRVVADDLLATASREGGVEPPPGLLSGLRELPPGTASAEEVAIADQARLLTHFYAGLDETLAFADQLATRLPSESDQLVRSTLRYTVVAEFADDAEDATARLLRSATCETARATIDDATDAGIPAYEEMDVEDPGAAARWISSELSEGWSAADVDAVLDTASLASKTLTRAAELVDEAGTVIESPNGTILRANILYFRMCVLH